MATTSERPPLTLVYDEQPWPSPHEPSRQATAWRDDDGRAFAVAWVGERFRWIEWTALGTFRFDDRSPDVWFHGAPGVDPARVQDTFGRIVQPLILQARGRPVLHASAAAGPDGAIVFCGVSGSGKSTLAHAVGRVTGFRQLADDAVAMRHGAPGRFVVTPLPFRPRLRKPAADFFAPVRAPGIIRRPEPVADVPLRAVVVLTQASATGNVTDAPQLTRAAPAAAFSLLVTHAHCFDEGDPVAMSALVETYLAMAAAVPVLQLRYRPDFDQLPRLLSLVAPAAAETVGAR